MKIKKIVFLVNHEIVIYNFRKEIAFNFLASGYEVYILSPKGEKITILEENGLKHIEFNINRKGKNFFQELKTFMGLFVILSRLKPSFLFTFTIKPNIYGGIISRILRIKFIPNITGLGQTFLESNSISMFFLFLYKISFKTAKSIFVQNKFILETFIRYKIYPNKLVLIPGSGVNLKENQYHDYYQSNKINVLFLGRIMKAKGIEIFVNAAYQLKKISDKFEFHVCGLMEENYVELIKIAENDKILKYYGQISNTNSFFKQMSVTALPSYYPEGISNVLLESLAAGRPIITSTNPGCFELLDGKKNGLLLKSVTEEDLTKALLKFSELTNEEILTLSKNGRLFVENFYDRENVISIYNESLK
jgi:glycosyltransferase involved in cell wall biosynthesis